MKIGFEEGSGNVFADLGLPDADELYLRAQIGFLVLELLRKQNLTEHETGKLLRIPKAEVSHLMNGRFSRFSESQLRNFLVYLDNQGVELDR